MNMEKLKPYLVEFNKKSIIKKRLSYKLHSK